MSDTAPLPVLDPTALERLRRIGGASLAAQMIDLFVEHAPRRIGDVRAGLGDGDPRDAERGAHSLKSTAGNLGADRLTEAARELELAVAGGNLETARAAAPHLERALEEALDALRALRRGLEP